MDYRNLIVVAALSLAGFGCSDDTPSGDGASDGDSSTGSNATGGGTTAADTAADTTGGGGSGDTTAGPADSTGTPGTTASTDGSDSGSDSGSTAGSDSGDSGSTAASDSSGSTGGGFEVMGCGSCNEGEVCRANLSFQTEYECVPIPEACEAEANCDCAMSVCEDPFVACDEPPEKNSISCICIAC